MKAIAIFCAGVICLFLFFAVGEYVVGLYAQKRKEKKSPFGVGFFINGDKK